MNLLENTQKNNQIPPKHFSQLRPMIYQSLLDLATDDGINASGKQDVYSCIFGRDSAITILKLLKVVKNGTTESDIDTKPLLEIAKRGLQKLVNLQGKETNIESGEQPGKFIHEYRKDNFERLVKRKTPWYVYPDNTIKNYDSLDSTPLTLIALHRYWELTGDSDLLLSVLPAVEKGLNWIISYGDSDKDVLLEYELLKVRKHGGLRVQSWTDSIESMLDEHGEMPCYPIAPVEVQGYAWLALKLWADFYADQTVQVANTKQFANKLQQQATNMKKRFNDAFIFEDETGIFAAQALDGYKNKITTVTGNPMLLLWATYEKDSRNQPFVQSKDKNSEFRIEKECILDEQYIEPLVRRTFAADMFEDDAGIRTMSSKSKTFNPSQDSYHNGSFWPKLNGMSHEGLANWEYEKEAALLFEATLKPIEHFGTPIELYIKTSKGSYIPYMNKDGQKACGNQAWSAAVALDLLTL